MKFDTSILVATLALAYLGLATPVARPKFRFPSGGVSKHLRPVLEKRDTAAQFVEGQPVDGKGKGAPISGMSQIFTSSQALHFLVGEAVHNLRVRSLTSKYRRYE